MVEKVDFSIIHPASFNSNITKQKGISSIKVFLIILLIYIFFNNL